jgi:4-hydroxy-4-methyl-2-oxoglutarate aldolase
MGIDAKSRSLAGLVIDGAVRDAEALREINFAVFCTGTSPLPARKKIRGALGKPIKIKGVRIESNDYIIADRDSIVVIPGDAWKGVRAKALETCQREAGIRKRLAKGEHLLEILGLPPLHSD